MRRVLVVMVIAVVVLVVAGFAAGPVAAGQPNASCEAVSSSPGHASSAPGSAFNPNGVAGTQYAGQQPQNSNNVHSVSQYDVACLQVSTH